MIKWRAIAYNICEVSMWSNVISVDKIYTREINYVLSSVSRIKALSHAMEQSDDRIWIYLAATCENKDAIEGRVLEICSNVFLDFFKLRYLVDHMKITAIDHAMCALLSSMVHFDREFENNIVLKVMSECEEYSLDGIMNFRLSALRESWAELADVAGRLVEGCSIEQDMYDIANFITGTDGGKNQIILDSHRLRNITRHKEIEVVKMFDEEEYNLISAIISENPCEILIDGCKLSGKTCATLKKLARVIEK